MLEIFVIEDRQLDIGPQLDWSLTGWRFASAGAFLPVIWVYNHFAGADDSIRSCD